MAAAGLWTTPTDLARFMLGVVAARSGRPGALVSKDVAADLLSGHEVAAGMGLGLFLGGSGEIRTFGHGGANNGFTGRIVSTVDGSFGLVSLTNSNEGNAAAGDLFRFLAEENEVPELLSTSSMGQEAQEGMMRAGPIEHKEPAAVPRDTIEALLGEYESEHAGPVWIEKSNGMISVRTGIQNAMALYPHSDHEWVSKAIDIRIEFDADQLRLHQLGRTVEAKKVR